MRSRIVGLRSIAAMLVGLGMATSIAQAADVPSSLPSGMTTHNLFFAWFNQNGVFCRGSGACGDERFFEPRELGSVESVRCLPDPLRAHGEQAAR